MLCNFLLEADVLHVGTYYYKNHHNSKLITQPNSWNKHKTYRLSRSCLLQGLWVLCLSQELVWVRSLLLWFLSVHHYNVCDPDCGCVDFPQAPVPSPGVTLSSLHTYPCPFWGWASLLLCPLLQCSFQGCSSVSAFCGFGALTLQILRLLFLRGTWISVILFLCHLQCDYTGDLRCLQFAHSQPLLSLSFLTRFNKCKHLIASSFFPPVW